LGEGLRAAPANREDIMSIIFPGPKPDSATQKVLEAAFNKAREELVDVYYESPAKLKVLSEAMSVAISDLYYAGERDITRLADYAVYRAVQQEHLPRP
jgi:hypothetical protein